MQQKVVFITGASSGFGKLCVPLLLKKGYHVILGIRGGKDRLEQLFAEELKHYSSTLNAVELDLNHPSTIEAAAKFLIESHHGKLDILINNAGYGLFGALEDASPDQIRQQMEVNFMGPCLLTRSLLPFLRRSQGKILVTSSIAGRYSFPFYGLYSASKFALEGLFEGLYYELKPFGVQVCLIEPGGFKTEFLDSKAISQNTQGSSSTSLSSPYSKNFQNLLNNMDRFKARLGDPNRVARLIVRLCEQRRLPFRKAIGADASTVSILFRIIPQSIWMPIMEYLFRKTAP